MRPAVLALLLAGCSYDWAVSSGTPDGGRDALLPADASVADSGDGAPGDATTEANADATPMDSPVEAEVPDAQNCQQLLQTAKNDLPPALVCTPTMAGVCTFQTTDWCGCTVYLADGTSPAYMTFVGDVNAFDSAGCRSTINCGDACPAASSNCVVADAMAPSYACFR